MLAYQGRSEFFAKMAESRDGEQCGHLRRTLHVGADEFVYYDVTKYENITYDDLPFCLRIFLESFVRNSKCHSVPECCVESCSTESCSTWPPEKSTKIMFHPTHVIWQDFTGLPSVIDMAAMRDAVCERGIDPELVGPKCQVDIILDSSPPFVVSGNTTPSIHERDSIDEIQRSRTVLDGCSEEICPVHFLQIQSESVSNLIRNQQMEFERNRERFLFLKWSSLAFENVRIVPPGSGVMHQFNLEYLANVVFNSNGCLYPDSVVGIDSHITMLNGLGVLSFGVGPMEAEAVMVGEPIEMVLPDVVGCRLIGQPSLYITSTDIVLAITKCLRQSSASGKLVEFFGSGVRYLTISDRTTIANMCPEYGAIAGFFPADEVTLNYLTCTGRESARVALIREYLSAMKMLRNYEDESQDPKFTEIVEVDLSTITSDCSGPKTPKDRVPFSLLKEDFRRCLENLDSTRGFGERNLLAQQSFNLRSGQEFSLKHGDVIFSSIASCTNNTNASVMLAAGLLAKKAADAGLMVKPYLKASISPGTGIVTHYLNSSHLVKYMQQLGFTVGGYGCPGCVSQTCPLEESIVNAVQVGDIVAVGVMSGGRNSDAHAAVKGSYLMSPLLVIAYALAGNVAIDFELEPIGSTKEGHPVYLRNIWPSRQEIMDHEQSFVIPMLHKEVQSKIEVGTSQWNKLEALKGSSLFRWSPSSTYISCPPFFEDLTEMRTNVFDIANAHVLLSLGNNVSSDYISPAGSIARNTPAGKYLIAKRLTPRELNSFGARRGCDAVMARSTFANLRLENKLVKGPGPKTIHLLSKEIMDVFDVAERYRRDGTPVLILAGSNFGCGSAREWAAKGPWMLGVKAVIAESYNEGYRSSLVAVGIIPLEFLPGENAAKLGLTGLEKFSIAVPSTSEISIRQKLEVQLNTGRSFNVIAKLETCREVAYIQHGGVLRYAAHRLLRSQSQTTV